MYSLQALRGLSQGGQTYTQKCPSVASGVPGLDRAGKPDLTGTAELDDLTCSWVPTPFLIVVIVLLLLAVPTMWVLCPKSSGDHARPAMDLER